MGVPIKISDLYGRVYRGIREIRGSLIVLDPIPGVVFDEIIRIRAPDGLDRLGRVIEVSRKYIIAQVFGDEAGLQHDAMIKFTGSTFEIPVSPDIIGRMFNGRFDPIDGLPRVSSRDTRDINGSPINPRAREYPHEFIQTGLSAIDGMLSLVRGQKLPIFSESGLPHNRVAAQIARQATIPGKEESFALVFAAMGLKHDEASYFISQFRESGAIDRSVVILNLADDPAVERLITPRIALTIAEYLAFELDYHVLTILTDMTNYCEALREISAAREEVPGRGGYPGYMYSDLATIYERAGIVKGKRGSLTQMPILTMPGGDKRHPIPDLTGYITEGQIILSKDLNSRGIYPPINVLPSLSRLMRGGIGPGKTRDDHKELSDQLYDAYSRGVKARDLARIVGETGLSDRERLFLKFADLFEKRFISQGEYENRSIEDTLDIGWEVLSILPPDELTRVRESTIEKYYYKARTAYEGIKR